MKILLSAIGFRNESNRFLWMGMTCTCCLNPLLMHIVQRL